MSYFVIAIIAYLLGSIPFGYILVKLFLQADVRQTGSGNIGATNVARTGHKGLAIATLFLDALKGTCAVLVGEAFATSYVIGSRVGDSLTVSTHEQMVYRTFLFGALAALFAIIGHMYPVWLKFKGGKGVATGMGVFVALAPKAVLIVLAVFIIVVAISRYISLGSIIAAALFPAAFLLLEREYATPPVLAMVAGVSLLIIWKHKDNIRRLMAGTENRFGR